MLSVANLSIPNHSNLENLKKKFEKVPERTKKPDEEKKLGEIMKEEQFVKEFMSSSIQCAQNEIFAPQPIVKFLLINKVTFKD